MVGFDLINRINFVSAEKPRDYPVNHVHSVQKNKPMDCLILFFSF